MTQKKVSGRLAAQVETLASDAEMLDVIVELEHRSAAEDDSTLAQKSGISTRTARIAARKESFARAYLPVENAIAQAGGEVMGRAWLNRTVRARLPAKSLRIISELEEVENLDAPRELEPDFKD